MLTTDDVYKRIRNGEEPMDLSLDKWRGFLAAARTRDKLVLRQQSISYKTCGLCVASVDVPCGDWHPACYKCPIGILTHASGCMHTPYYDAVNAFLRVLKYGSSPEDWDRLVGALEREVDFLEAVQAGDGDVWLESHRQRRTA